MSGALLARALVGAAVLVPAARAQHWFDAISVYPQTATAPLAVVSDLDGDGRSELVGRGGIDWYSWKTSGKGDIAIGARSAIPVPGSNTGPPLVQDFDGDSLPDLAYTEFGVGLQPGTLRFQRGIGGLSFNGGDFVNLPLAPRRFTSGDFDSNGILDVAVLSAAGTQAVVGWYRHTPIGWLPSETDADIVSASFAIASIDYERDGLADIAVGVSNHVAIYTSSTGAPLPTASFDFPTALAGLFGPSLLAADFDGDGDRDLLGYTAASQSTTLSLATQVAGFAFSIGAAQTIPGTLGIASAGDWDGDGDLDVCAGLQVVRNDGGSFGTSLIAGAAGSSNLGIGAGMADVDADGHMDLVAEGSVYFGDGGYAFALPSGPIGVHGLLVDWEGEGDLDGVALASPALKISDGVGYATQPFELPALPTDHFYGDGRALADFDGDGARDVLIAEQKLLVAPPSLEFQGTKLLRGDGLGHFHDAGLAAPQPQLIGVPIGFLKGQIVVDAEADGDLDVLGQNGFWYNDGAGFFGAWDDFGAHTVHDCGDFDGDGDFDLVGWGDTTALLELHTMVAPGQYGVQLLATPGVSGTLNAAVFDLDDDLDADIAALEANGAHLALPLENQGGAFVARAATDAGTGALLHAFDVDGDGKTDLAASEASGGANGQVVVWRRAGPGLVYEPGRRWVGGALLCGDVDEDGDVDFVGPAILRNRAADPLHSGVIKQYGSATAGTLGVAPVLGYTGPLEPGALVQLRLRHVSGTGPAILGYSNASANFAGFPFPSTTLAIDFVGLHPLIVIGLAPTGGLSKGFTLTIPMIPVLAGLHWYKQAFVFDTGAPDLYTATRGLDVRYGQ